MQIASKRRDHRCAMQTVILLKSINNKDDKNLLGRRRSRELVFHRIVILICTSRSPQGLIWILLLNLKQDLRNTISSNTLECEKQRCVELSSTHVCFRLLQSTTKLLLELVFKIERWKSTCSSHSSSSKKKKKRGQQRVKPLCSESTKKKTNTTALSAFTIFTNYEYDRYNVSTFFPQMLSASNMRYAHHQPSVYPSRRYHLHISTWQMWKNFRFLHICAQF